MIDEMLGLFPPQLVGALLTDVLSCVAEEVEQALKHVAVFDHLELLQVHDFSLELIGAHLVGDPLSAQLGCAFGPQVLVDGFIGEHVCEVVIQKVVLLIFKPIPLRILSIDQLLIVLMDGVPQRYIVTQVRVLQLGPPLIVIMDHL